MPKKAPQSQVQTPSWELVWADEFDVEGLPDKKKWTYEYGFVRNNEAQYYTRARKENARVEDGKLIIECRKERYLNAGHKPGSENWRQKGKFADYTSASLTTQGIFSLTYGRVEMRAKLPRGRGVWPAFWTLGVNITDISWPRSGEIDIMEFVGKEPNVVHANAHFARDGKHASQTGRLKTQELPQALDPCDDFHIYAVEWFEDRLDFYFDDVKYHTLNLDALASDDDAFRKPHYVLLNFAIGGDWGGEIDDSALPQQFVVDYVRVYRQAKGKDANASVKK